MEDPPDMLRQFESETLRGPNQKAHFRSQDYPRTYQPKVSMEASKPLNNPWIREDQTIPTSFLMTLLGMVLGGNFFMFVGQFYCQMIGTAIGTPLAPTYACLFMAWLEVDKLLGQWRGIMPHLWHTYNDDIFFICHGTEAELVSFLDHLNSRHRLIKFTGT